MSRQRNKRSCAKAATIFSIELIPPLARSKPPARGSGPCTLSDSQRHGDFLPAKRTRIPQLADNHPPPRQKKKTKKKEKKDENRSNRATQRQKAHAQDEMKVGPAAYAEQTTPALNTHMSHHHHHHHTTTAYSKPTATGWLCLSTVNRPRGTQRGPPPASSSGA